MRTKLYQERSGSMSERRQRNQKELPQRRKTFIQKKDEDNPFMKIKLDMDEILNKKISMFPRVNSQHTKRKIIPKL
jgi:hypothetical protein